MDPLPKCIVGNNFGAMSKLYGAGAHEGVDIAGTLGQHVFAVEDGVLSRQFADTGAAGLGWELRPPSATCGTATSTCPPSPPGSPPATRSSPAS